MSNKLYFPSDEGAYGDTGDGFARNILAHGGKLMLVRASFETGAVGKLHHHPHEQATYILSGEFIFTIGDQEFHCNPGDSVYMPPDVPHGAKCLKEGQLLDIFTPMRDDFLANFKG